MLVKKIQALFNYEKPNVVVKVRDDYGVLRDIYVAGIVGRPENTFVFELAEDWSEEEVVLGETEFGGLPAQLVLDLEGAEPTS